MEDILQKSKLHTQKKKESCWCIEGFFVAKIDQMKILLQKFCFFFCKIDSSTFQLVIKKDIMGLVDTATRGLDFPFELPENDAPSKLENKDNILALLTNTTQFLKDLGRGQVAHQAKIRNQNNRKFAKSVLAEDEFIKVVRDNHIDFERDI